MTIKIPQEVFEKTNNVGQSVLPYEVFWARFGAVIPPEADVLLVKQIHRDLYYLSFPKIQLLRLDREKTQVNRLYLETRQFIYHAPIELPAYVQLKPSVQELTRFGIDESRELLVVFSIGVLEFLGLGANALTIGDKVIYDGTEYEVLSMNRYSFILNWNEPLDLVCTCNRFRVGE